MGSTAVERQQQATVNDNLAAVRSEGWQIRPNGTGEGLSPVASLLAAPRRAQGYGENAPAEGGQSTKHEQAHQPASVNWEAPTGRRKIEHRGSPRGH